MSGLNISKFIKIQITVLLNEHTYITELVADMKKAEEQFEDEKKEMGDQIEQRNQGTIHGTHSISDNNIGGYVTCVSLSRYDYLIVSRVLDNLSSFFSMQVTLKTP